MQTMIKHEKAHNYVFLVFAVLVMAICIVLAIAILCDLSSMVTISFPIKQAGKFVLGKFLEILIQRGMNGVNLFMNSSSI
ncbi:MAG TPA: hypothetical protein VHE99_09795 [Gammaproteobacteria bacterium]|nr:hypothetical protein [Gammaproteobacteria bacterium]